MYPRILRSGATALCVLQALNPVIASSDLGVPTGSNVIYVSPDGSDSGSGTLSSPLRTLDEAKRRASALIQATSSGATILLQGGVYALDAPVVFDPEHSGRPGAPLVIQNAPGQTPTLDGSFEFGEGLYGKWEPVSIETVSGTRQVYRFVFDSEGRQRLDRIAGAIRTSGANNGAFVFTQLFSSDQRLIRSRHPNSATHVSTKAWDGRFNHIPKKKRKGSEYKQRAEIVFSKKNLKLPSVDLLLDGHTEALFTRTWQTPRGIVREAKEGRRGYTLELNDMQLEWEDGEHMSEVHAGVHQLQYRAHVRSDRAWLENNLAFVDSPGEWYMNESDWALYLDPPAKTDLSSARFQLPFLYQAIILQGRPGAHVTDIQFKGIEFRHTQWQYANGEGTKAFYAFIQASYGLGGVLEGNFVDRIRVEGCSFNHYGLTGIFLGGSRTDSGNFGYDGAPMSHATGIELVNNRFEDGGGGAIRIDHRVSMESGSELDNNRIEDNRIENTGRVFQDTIGILVMGTRRTEISNNRITSVPYSGISAGWGCRQHRDAKIEIVGNRIQNAMTTLADGGAIYTFGNQGVIRNNRTSGIGKSRSKDAVGTVSATDVGIYIDNVSQYYRVENNDTGIFISKSRHNRILNSGNSTVNADLFGDACGKKLASPTWWN